MAAPHAIHEEFPGQADRLHQLKMADGRFARLLREHDEINGRAAGAEARQSPVPGDAETGLRKRHASLKDEIARALAGG